jgi:RNA polymerase sigma factor (sigma-70 family)
MRPDTEVNPETRRSLLSRLRDLDDRESWRAFFDRYWRMLYRVARRSGLDDADAQDVVQETVVAVARKMPEFRYDPARGGFKQWLFQIVRRRVADHLRRVYRQPRAQTTGDSEHEDGEAMPAIPDEQASSLDATLEEWQEAIYKAALEKVRESANPKHFQAFDCCVRLGWPTAKVAAAMGMSAAQVYLARHRISQAVKRAARAINEERSTGF